MIIHKTTSHLTSVSLVALALLMVGCAQTTKTEHLSSVTPAQLPHSTRIMSPAQRDRWFREAYSQGMQLVQDGKYGLALGSFQKALSLKPDAIDAMFNMGACYEAMGDPDRAIGIYRRILQYTPNDPDCYANLGTCYIKLFYREKSPVWRKMAREAWRHSLQLNPDQPQIQGFIARGQSMD